MSTPLKDARVRKLLTQPELARLSGVSVDTIKRAERGVPIKELTQEKLAQALGRRRQTLFPEPEEASA